MELILHIGPFKTATTSIQHVIDDNRSILAGSGIYVPLSSASERAHHAYATMILNYRRNPSEANQIESRLTELWKRSLQFAEKQSSSTLFITTESFSDFTEQDWQELNRVLVQASSESGVVIESIRLLWTNRDLESATLSMAQEAIKLGSCLDNEEALTVVRAELMAQKELCSQAASSMTIPTKFEEIELVLEGESENFISRWLQWAFGQELASKCILNESNQRMNERVSDEGLASIFEFNLLNTPESLRNLSKPFWGKVNQESREAFARLSFFKLMLLRCEGSMPFFPHWNPMDEIEPFKKMNEVTLERLRNEKSSEVEAESERVKKRLALFSAVAESNASRFPRVES